MQGGKSFVCDDDKQIVEAINIYLTGEGFGDQGL